MPVIKWHESAGLCLCPGTGLAPATGDTGSRIGSRTHEGRGPLGVHPQRAPVNTHAHHLLSRNWWFIIITSCAGRLSRGRFWSPGLRGWLRAAASREHNAPVGAQQSAASNAKRLFRWQWVRGPISGGPISGRPSCPPLLPLACLVCPSELPAAPDAHSETTLCPFPRNPFSPPLLSPLRAPSFPNLARALGGPPPAPGDPSLLLGLSPCIAFLGQPQCSLPRTPGPCGAPCSSTADLCGSLWAPGYLLKHAVFKNVLNTRVDAREMLIGSYIVGQSHKARGGGCTESQNVSFHPVGFDRRPNKAIKTFTFRAPPPASWSPRGCDSNKVGGEVRGKT